MVPLHWLIDTQADAVGSGTLTCLRCQRRSFTGLEIKKTGRSHLSDLTGNNFSCEFKLCQKKVFVSINLCILLLREENNIKEMKKLKRA